MGGTAWQFRNRYFVGELLPFLLQLTRNEAVHTCCTETNPTDDNAILSFDASCVTSPLTLRSAPFRQLSTEHCLLYKTSQAAVRVQKGALCECILLSVSVTALFASVMFVTCPGSSYA